MKVFFSDFEKFYNKIITLFSLISKFYYPKNWYDKIFLPIF